MSDDEITPAQKEMIDRMQNMMREYLQSYSAYRVG